MNLLIIGCGKTGARLAELFSRRGADVSILDNDARSFDALPDDFNGFTSHGVPIDTDNLRKAGIESCDALIAVTHDDNVNIMVAQMAKELFHVKKVFARIYDPRRGDVFADFGLYTICPTNLTIAAISSALLDYSDTHRVNLGNHTVSFTAIEIPKEYIGRYVGEIEFEENETLFAVERGAKMLLVSDHRMLLMKHDKLIFSKVED